MPSNAGVLLWARLPGSGDALEWPQKHPGYEGPA